jgi:hypothetical protein
LGGTRRSATVEAKVRDAEDNLVANPQNLQRLSRFAFIIPG